MRLAKHLAHAGVASRRHAERLIAAGHVAIDGITIIDPATDVTGRERITLGGELVKSAPEHRGVWAVNKPAGVVSTAKDTHKRPVVVDLVHAPGRRLYPVGRLDAETTGLLLLTNDGELAQQLTHPSYEVPKTYRAKCLNPPVKEATLRMLREGIRLEDGMTLPAQARALSRDEVELTIREGRKHQVRRMLEAVGHEVVTLERVAFGPLRLGTLASGKSRRLTPAEVERLRSAGPETGRETGRSRG